MFLGKVIDLPGKIEILSGVDVNATTIKKNTTFAINLFQIISLNNDTYSVIQDNHITHKLSHKHNGGIRLRHSAPVLFARSIRLDNENDADNKCTDSSDDFPEIFTDEQNKNGYVFVCFVIGIYCFTLLAIICDNYFLPCVDRFCEVFEISEVSKRFNVILLLFYLITVFI